MRQLPYPGFYPFERLRELCKVLFKKRGWGDLAPQRARRIELLRFPGGQLYGIAVGIVDLFVLQANLNELEGQFLGLPVVLAVHIELPAQQFRGFDPAIIIPAVRRLERAFNFQTERPLFSAFQKKSS